MRSRWVLAITTGLAVTAAVTASAEVGAGPGAGLQHAELVGRSVLPALTFRPGTEPSGSLLGTTPINGVTPPFADQPVQGFSGLLRNGEDTFLALSDNGYGRQDNSADFLLQVHHIRPTLPTGTTTVLAGFGLADPDGHVPFPLSRPGRILTGADFDVESFQRLDDGSFWFGEEFGPFLLHTDGSGKVLEPPVPLPGVSSPQDPTAQVTPPNLGRSKGFEGMATAPSSGSLRDDRRAFEGRPRLPVPTLGRASRSPVISPMLPPHWRGGSATIVMIDMISTPRDRGWDRSASCRLRRS